MLLLYLFSVPVLASGRPPAFSCCFLSLFHHPLLATCVATGPRPGLPWWLSGKNPAAGAADVGLAPESGRPPGEGDDNPLQYSCLGKPMGGGACLRNERLNHHCQAPATAVLRVQAQADTFHEDQNRRQNLRGSCVPKISKLDAFLKEPALKQLT